MWRDDSEEALTGLGTSHICLLITFLGILNFLGRSRVAIRIDDHYNLVTTLDPLQDIGYVGTKVFHGEERNVYNTFRIDTDTFKVFLWTTKLIIIEDKDSFRILL